ncbi:MAG: serpin family protein [Prevotella sp.]|nr:serpin family protein [Prevotella sp.]
MKKELFRLCLIILCGGLFSCSSSEDTAQETVVNMLSDPQPIELTANQKIFVNDNNQFSLNFFKTVNESENNKSMVYSPLSIVFVLSMVNDAATGATEEELEKTLGFHNGGIKAVNEYCKNLIVNLPKTDSDVKLDIANAIFVNKNFSLKKQFSQDMSTYYDASAESLDFSSASSLNHINDWCNKKTNGMIKKILDKISPEAFSYLLNAIYFKADWASKFDKKKTKTEAFTTLKGSNKQPIMHQEVYIRYLQNDTFSAVDIPYGNGLWCMTVLLPKEGKTTDDVINKLAADGWGPDYYNNMMSEAQPYQVDLKLPRYETSSDTDELTGNLIGMLKAMGINRVFTDMADLPNMCEERDDIYISKMRQKAKILVNEEGAEAAAVTVAETRDTSALPSDPTAIPKADFHATRPFVYLIREKSSGVILFVGKYTGE